MVFKDGTKMTPICISCKKDLTCFDDEHHFIYYYAPNGEGMFCPECFLTHNKLDGQLQAFSISVIKQLDSLITWLDGCYGSGNLDSNLYIAAKSARLAMLRLGMRVEKPIIPNDSLELEHLMNSRPRKDLILEELE